jgi:Na+-transporting NADH:ubiquinone oxidoreductase subunit NqrB
MRDLARHADGPSSIPPQAGQQYAHDGTGRRDANRPWRSWPGLGCRLWESRLYRRWAPPLKRRWDPRLYQIATLTGLLVYGLGWLDFDVPGAHAAVILTTVLLTQCIGNAVTGTQQVATRLVGPARFAPNHMVLSALASFDPRSALISGLSLCLLLRTNSLVVAILTAVLAVGSKFVIRVGGKHVFNPTNFALVAMMLLTDHIWVSPGQWGSVAVFGFFLASAGALVVNRAARGDVTWAFLAFYAALVFGRSLWLGEPMSIPWHRLQNGALILFSFFMISDPKTTPDSRAGRILFAGLVAVGAGVVQFGLFRTNGLLWSLAFWSVFVPVLDRLLPAPRYAWDRVAAGPPSDPHSAASARRRSVDVGDASVPMTHRPGPTTH